MAPAFFCLREKSVGHFLAGMAGGIVVDVILAIEQLLYEVASWLYLPVIGGCALLVIYMPLQLGATLHEAWSRRHGVYPARRKFQRELDALLAGKTSAAHFALDVERLYQVAEVQIARSLDRVRFVIKVGPALGLMGTLIPMGISLAALAEGNIPKMAGSMVTAFTATVAGLGAGVAAYMLALLRERWARDDLREMAHAGDLAIVAREEAEKERGNGTAQ